MATVFIAQIIVHVTAIVTVISSGIVEASPLLNIHLQKADGCQVCNFLKFNLT